MEIRYWENLNDGNLEPTDWWLAFRAPASQAYLGRCYPARPRKDRDETMCCSLGEGPRNCQPSCLYARVALIYHLDHNLRRVRV